MKHAKIRIIIGDISKQVTICMYITHNILHLVNYHSILLCEFATNRNLTIATLMRNAFQLGGPLS